MNVLKMVSVLCLMAAVLCHTLGTDALADDYHVYVDWNPGVNYTTGVDGYVDEAGDIEGIPGAEYLFLVGGPSYEGAQTAYVYRVETAGDPDMHPDNPYVPGPIAPRTFTLVNSHAMGTYASGHDNEFYIDETGIYYGTSDNPRGGVPGWATFKGCGIYHWDFDWNPIGCVVPLGAPADAQTLARNPATGDWWVATWPRALYRWDGSAWVYQFTYPNLAGAHHDGLEIIGSSLFISDMTSDVIIEYRLDAAGDPIDPPASPYRTFTYTAGPHVEGMGFEPNHHIWITGWSSYTVYELGGGLLQCSLEDIPDQCVYAGEAFGTFDFDDYLGQLVEPVAWEWSGTTDLIVSVDGANVVTITYAAGWTGSETIFFTATDVNDFTCDYDAIFTVAPMLTILPIPDQDWPFSPFDLDDYVTGVDPADVEWAATGMVQLVVDIDPATHVVTVTNPGGFSGTELITFTGTVEGCSGDPRSASDDVLFDTSACVLATIGEPICECNNVYLPIELADVAGHTEIWGIDVIFSFDPDVIDPRGVEFEGTLLEDLGWMHMWNEPTPGEFRLGLAGSEAIPGDGVLVYLWFRAEDESCGLDTPLELDILLNEGDPCVEVVPVDHWIVPQMTGVPDGETSYELHAPAPNPSRQTTTISYHVPAEGGAVRIEIYGVTGRVVRTLVDGFVSGGRHEVTWHGRTDTGEKVASGIYFCRMEAPERTITHKLTFLE